MSGMFYKHQPSAPWQFGVVVSRFTFSSDLATPLQKDITGHRPSSACRAGGKSEIGCVGGWCLQSPIIAQAAGTPTVLPLGSPSPCLIDAGAHSGTWGMLLLCWMCVGRAEVFMQKLLNLSQNVPEVYLHWVTFLLVLDSKQWKEKILMVTAQA